MTKKQRQQYVRRGGVSCPYCRSGDIEGSSLEVNDGYTAQTVRCHGCDARWRDVYTLTDVEPIKG